MPPQGSAGGPGIAQCYLGAHITLESTRPCDGTDVLVDFGERCFPMTTSSYRRLRIVSIRDFLNLYPTITP